MKRAATRSSSEPDSRLRVAKRSTSSQARPPVRLARKRSSALSRARGWVCSVPGLLLNGWSVSFLLRRGVGPRRALRLRVEPERRDPGAARQFGRPGVGPLGVAEAGSQQGLQEPYGRDQGVDDGNTRRLGQVQVGAQEGKT